MVYRHHSDPYIMYASSLFKGTYCVMGSVEQLLGGNATSITLLHYQLIDLWRSPRGTVLRIEALALVAIALSFFLAIFGSCRRWSNRWIIQKGFMAAQVLSISLGTHSIGIMQSSSVKSEMYLYGLCPYSPSLAVSTQSQATMALTTRAHSRG